MLYDDYQISYPLRHGKHAFNERFSSKTLAIRLKQLEKNGILERKAYNEIPPRVVSSYRERPRACRIGDRTFAVDAKVVLVQLGRLWSLFFEKNG